MPAAGDGVEDQAGRQAQERQDHQARHQDGGGKPGHLVGVVEGEQQRHARTTATATSTPGTSEKNAMGRSDRSRPPMVRTIRKPSPKVESLLSEPSGRSR